MSEADNQSVICASCQRKFRWRADAVGKKFKCACGKVLAVPASPGIAKPLAAAASAPPAAPAAPAAAKPAPAPKAAPAPPPKVEEPAPKDDDDNTYELADPDEGPSAPPPPKPAAATPKRVGPQLDLKDDAEIAPAKPAAPATPAKAAPPAKVASTGSPSTGTPLPNLVLREDPRCPSCGGLVKKEAVLCVGCGYHLQSGEKVTTEVSEEKDEGGAKGSKIKRMLGGIKGVFKKKPKDESEDEGGAPAAANVSDRSRKVEERLADQEAEEAKKVRRQKFVDYLLPAILVVLGIGLTYLQEGVLAETPETTGTIFIMMGIKLILSVPLLFIGIILAHKVLDVVFGPAHIALYKLVAIAIGPGAIGGIIGLLCGGGLPGWFAAFLATNILFFTFIKVLFDDLDVGETINTMILMNVVENFALTFLLAFVASYLDL